MTKSMDLSEVFDKALVLALAFLRPAYPAFGASREDFNVPAANKERGG